MKWLSSEIPILKAKASASTTSNGDEESDQDEPPRMAGKKRRKITPTKYAFEDDMWMDTTLEVSESEADVTLEINDSEAAPSLGNSGDLAQ